MPEKECSSVILVRIRKEGNGDKENSLAYYANSKQLQSYKKEEICISSNEVDEKNNEIIQNPVLTELLSLPQSN